MRALLLMGANPNVLGGFGGMSALMEAAMEGHIAVINALLTGGAFVDLQSLDEGIAALSVAAREGQTVVLKRLLQAGADIDLQSREEHLTALHLGTIFQHEEVVRKACSPASPPARP